MDSTIFQPKQKSTVGFIGAITFFTLLFLSLLAVAFTTEPNSVYFHLLLLFNGWLAWTFTEYCQHRFHSHAAVSPRQTNLIAVHQYHHHHPTQIRITPIQRAALTVLSLTFIYLSVWFNNYFTLFTGYFLGFTGYTYMHWFLHTKMSARVFPVLHRFHIHHHCKHPDKCFGVSVPWWDFLFKTIPGEDSRISDRILDFYYRKTPGEKARPHNGVSAK